MTDTDWQKITVPKVPKFPPPPSLGQNAISHRTKKPKRMAAADRKVHLARHGACVEHVNVDGVAEPVCILRHQHRESVIAQARELTAEHVIFQRDHGT